MELAIFGISYLILFISIINYFTIRMPGESNEVLDSVTVLLPVRNEELNIEECITGLKAQQGVPNLRIVIINDQSEDKTVELAHRAIGADPRFSIKESGGPRPGWLGKVSALQSGYEDTCANFVITLDADVLLEPIAIASAINQLTDLKLDFVSPYPKQITQSLAERLVQPLLHWSWMSTVILRLAEKVPHSSTAVANGQFFLVRAEALKSVDGFTSVQNKILDDIEIARSLISKGYRGVVTEGSSLARTRMYRNFNEIRDGYGKSLHQAFGGLIGSVIAVALIFITGILPAILILTGSPLGWLVYSSIVFSRMLSDTKAQTDSFFAILHPISSAILIYLIFYSWKKRGSIQWKGRTV